MELIHNNKINFQKTRSFNELFSDSFAFIRNEKKPLARLLLKYVTPIYFLFFISYGIYSSSMFGLDPTSSLHQLFRYEYSFYILLAVITIATYVYFIILRAVSMAYILGYVQTSDEQTKFEIVKSNIKPFFFNFLKLFIVFSFFAALITAPLIGLIAAGESTLSYIIFLLLFVAYVYLLTSLSLTLPAIVFEGKSIWEAPGRSRKLIRGNWWFTFGSLIILLIIYQVFSFFFDIPKYVMTFINFTLVFGNLGGQAYFGTFLLILSAFISGLGIVISIIFDVFLSLHFFSIREKKEAHALSARIDKLARKDSNEDNSADAGYNSFIPGDLK